MASDDPFAGFDWQRTDHDSDASTGAGGRRRYRGNSMMGGAYQPTTSTTAINGHAYEQVDFEPARNPLRSHSIDILSSADHSGSSPRRQQLRQLHKKASSFESNLETEGYVRKPYMPVGITVEDLDGRGQMSAVSKSPGRLSLGLSESPGRFSPRTA